MRQIEKDVEYYKELLEKMESLKDKIKDEAKSQGYDFNETTGCLTQNSDEVYVMDIYIRSESTYESFGMYSSYAGLIQMSEDYFNDIKDKITKNKEDWEDILQSDFFFNDKNFDNFRDGMFWIDYINEDMFTNIFLAEDDAVNLSREGVIEFFGEAYFEKKDNSCSGYISIFKMNKEYYEKNKHEEFFHNTKYLMDNAPDEYTVW